MGYSPIDKTPIALCKVAVNNVYDMPEGLETVPAIDRWGQVLQ
jgi:hypothetical protein